MAPYTPSSISPPASEIAVIKTSKGDIRVQPRPATTPLSTWATC